VTAGRTLGQAGGHRNLLASYPLVTDLLISLAWALLLSVKRTSAFALSGL
jgi:hypothetical protein